MENKKNLKKKFFFQKSKFSLSLKPSNHSKPHLIIRATSVDRTSKSHRKKLAWKMYPEFLICYTETLREQNKKLFAIEILKAT